MHYLADPLAYAFIRHALIVCTFAGGLCGLLGVYVTLKGMSYIGHGLSHAIFGGAAICAAVGLDFFIGAGIWGLASGLAVSRVTRRRIIGSDAAVGVITTASFAFGIALLGLYNRVKQSVDATIFGSVLGVTTTDVLVIIAATLATIIVIIAFYRPLLFTTFDAEVADVSGVDTDRVDALLMLLLCAAILASMRVLGVTLIAAALVTPPVVTRMLTNSFSRMLWISSGIGAAAGLTGMYLSYYLDISSGATIVLVNFAAFALVYAATTPRRLAHRTRPASAKPIDPSPRMRTIPTRSTPSAVIANAVAPHVHADRHDTPSP
jgi:ABC-type Mn2+/Zn2+ transport system permease subunit